MAELRVYSGDTFLCRAINPDLAGETIGLKDIIRARNEHRRQLRATFADREATVEALLQVRRGQLPLLSEPAVTESEAVVISPSPTKPRLKRYFNDE